MYTIKKRSQRTEQLNRKITKHNNHFTTDWLTVITNKDVNIIVTSTKEPIELTKWPKLKLQSKNLQKLMKLTPFKEWDKTIMKDSSLIKTLRILSPRIITQLANRTSFKWEQMLRVLRNNLKNQLITALPNKVNATVLSSFQNVRELNNLTTEIRLNWLRNSLRRCKKWEKLRIKTSLWEWQTTK